MNSIAIFSARVAKDLIRSRRFKLIDISADKKIKIKTVFYFEDTEDLREYLKDNFNIEI